MALSKVKPQIVLLFGVVVGFLFGNYNSKTSSEVNQTEINVAKFVGLSGVKLQQSDSAKPTGISGYMNHPECPHGYTEEDFRKQNSGKLPARNWTYGPKGICENDDAKNCLASFIPVKELPTIFTATPAKFGACSVRKSMSRIMRQIACMLTNPLNYLLLGWDLIDSAFGTGTPGYGCKHDCYGCGPNVTCFLEAVTQNLHKMAQSGDLMDSETNHVMPANWFCELYKTYDKYTFLKYDDDSEIFFNRELEPVLKKQNVSAEILSYIKSRMTSKRTVHSTNGFKLRSFLKDRILNSSYLTEMIVRLYYQDFKAFNFTLPIPRDK